MTRALEGIRVLDLGSYVAAPYCCMLLADHGAEVIRAEPPGGKVDRELGPFSSEGQPITYGLTVQRNKKNITLNLRSERGKGLLEELVKKMDVLVHNYPMGSQEAALLTYKRLSGINPALVVTAISGFGQTGPYAERLCFDSIAQAMSGYMSFSGYPGSPPLKASLPFIDYNTAARAALGTMLALFERKTSGQGQLVDIALFDVAFSITAASGCAAEYKMLGELRKQIGNCGFYAYGGSCRARDGYLMINIIGNNIWRRICRVMDREDLISDPRFKDNLSRYRNYESIDVILNEWIKEKTVAEARQNLEKAGVPCGPVNDVPGSLEVPQVEAREMLVEVDYPGTGKVPVPGVDIKLSRTPGQVAKRASFLGEDNEAVYCGLLGYKPDDLLRFEQEKAI
ncbi:MAG: CoA transferase [Deltaproteobacteria bacterium]|nr:CoA transferase [Deltaproteobacteria bacterium]